MTAVEITFDPSIHSADAIQRAAYKYCDRFSLELKRVDDLYQCVLRFPDNTDPDPAIVEDFRTEVLDQVLRERIRDETEAVRNVVLAHAFSKTNLLGE